MRMKNESLKKSKIKTRVDKIEVVSKAVGSL